MAAPREAFEMKFVFYDTETTGLSTDFDQILQFAAVLTDGEFCELDRFETRCRVLPWIVPSPTSLRVTNTDPARLTDCELLSHYEMLCTIRQRLDEWSPATFVGYNSIRFDEEFLRRALRQTLQSPWLTVSNGNSRLDVLTLAQAASFLAPKALNWPVDSDGRKRFRLDQLAPLNGFVHEAAHDALGDTLATIHLARLLANRAPSLWTTAVSRTTRGELEAVTGGDQLMLCIDTRDGAAGVYCQRLLQNPHNPAAVLVARLDTDWETLSKRADDRDLRVALSRPQLPVRSLSLNKSPVLFTAEECRNYWGILPSPAVRKQSQFLADHPEVSKRIAEIWLQRAPLLTEPQHLEQTLYGGFPSREDEKRCSDFHRQDWPGRATAIRNFEDPRLKQWGQRLVYADAPNCLDAVDRMRLDQAIAQRLLHDTNDETLWRSIPAAIRELDSLDAADPIARSTRGYLSRLQIEWQNRRANA